MEQSQARNSVHWSQFNEVLSSAARSFEKGRLSTTELLLTNAYAPVYSSAAMRLSPAGELAQETNVCAVNISHTRQSRRSFLSSGTTVTRAEKTADNAGRETPTECACLGGLGYTAFCAEVAATSAYNAVLAAMQEGLLLRAQRCAVRAIPHILDFGRVALGVFDCEGVVSDCASGSCRHYKRARPWVTPVGFSSHVQRTKRAWVSLASICRALRCWISRETLAVELSSALCRWADAAAALFEISGAVFLLCQDPKCALDAEHVAENLRELQRVLNERETRVPDRPCDSRFPPRSGACAVRSQVNDVDSSDVGDPNSGSPALGSRKRKVREANLTKLPLGDEARSRANQGFDTSHEILKGSDTQAQLGNGWRSRYLAALAHANSGDWGTALDIVVEAARLALPDSCVAQNGLVELSSPSVHGMSCHWPSAYLAALTMIRLGRREHVRLSTAVLDSCSREGYRTADSCALAAWVATGDDAIVRWERALTLDHVRPGALWSASKVFGMLGRHDKRVNLLKGLKKVLSMTKPGHGMTANPCVLPLCFEDVNDSRRSHLFRCSRGSLHVRDVRIEYAQALSAAHDWSTALDVINDLSLTCSKGEASRAGGAERSWLSKESVWALACLQRTGLVHSVFREAFGQTSNACSRCSLLLAQADSYVNSGQFKHAQESLLRAFREARLGSLSAGDGVPESACMLSSSASLKEDAVLFLRGLCYNNLGVVRACSGEMEKAATSFLAAEVAFSKCFERGELGPWRGQVAKSSRQHCDAAIFNKCVILWNQGLSSEAIETWIGSQEIRQLSPDSLENYMNRLFMDEKIELQQCPLGERIRSSNVLGELSNAQRLCLTSLCISHRHAADEKRRLEADMARWEERQP